MNVLNKLIVAALPAIPKPVVRQFANRYIAGEHTDDAVRVVTDLNSKNILATLDVLGEDIHHREEATSSTNTILELFSVITQHRLNANVSIKLTQLGLKLDKPFCLENMRTIASAAQAAGNFIRIDMEDSTCTDDTIRVYRELRKDFKNIGIVLQAYLRRTMDDARALIEDGMNNFRLCKGIYIEPESIAYKSHEEINLNFRNVLQHMLQQKAYVGIATHDEELITAATGMIKEMKLQPAEYEFQMLLGVRPELRSRILDHGHRLRVYVPFGKQWYQYSIRRFKENPKIAGYVFKALFSRIQLN